MKVIAVDALLSIAKDVTLANGAKHRCIDATQIIELPKTEIVHCKDCEYYLPEIPGAGYCDCNGMTISDEFYCASGKQKDGDGDAD